MKRKYYHMIIQPAGQWPDDTSNRKEYISTTQGAAPPGWRCVGVCGYHEKSSEVLYPCRGCVYYATCGSSTRTQHCDGRRTKTDIKMEVDNND